MSVVGRLKRGIYEHTPTITIGGPAVDRFDAVGDRLFDRLRGRPTFDRAFYGATELGDHGLIWLMLGCARSLAPDRQAESALRLAIAMGVESALVNGGIKSLFRRKRPVHELPRPFKMRTPRSSSFPSGHSTSAMMAAALLSQHDPALKPAYYGLALVVATSRVFVRIHHPTDVAAGILVGYALGRIATEVYPFVPSDPANPLAP